jgi:vancomycin permeability regulator SanA
MIVIARGLAAFFAAYAALSLGSLILGGSYNQNAWWINLSMLPTPISLILQCALVVVLVAFVIRVPRRRRTRWLGAATCALFCLFALLNVQAVYEAQAAGSVRLGFPLPFSFFIALAFLWLALALLLGYRRAPTSDAADAPRELREPEESGMPETLEASGAAEVSETPRASKAQKGNGTPSRKHSRVATVFGIIATVVVAGILFPLGQIFCFGMSDYRRPVDAVVVFGAQVYPDGTPSRALKDRLDAAIDIYEQGYTPVLIMSGGVDIDGVNEAQAMKDYAVSCGVPGDAVLTDKYGNTTEATAQNTIELAREHGFAKLGVTSTFYHMARIKMLYLANGIDAFTMPAPINKHDTSIPFTTLREVPGWWYYWFADVFK